MKNIRKFGFLAALAALMWCCKPVEQAQPQDIPVQGTITPSSELSGWASSGLKATQEGLEKTVSFASTAEWVVSIRETTKATPTWLHADKLYGDAGSDCKVVLTVDENPDMLARSASVEISSGESAVTFTVSQDARSYVAAESLTLSETALSLIKGETAELTVTVVPENTDDQGLVWTSSDPGVVTVEDGHLEAVATGTATITVSLAQLSATCRVTVSNPVNAISLDRSTLTLTRLETARLTATIDPADADDVLVTWTSSNAAVATVEEGLVTAVSAGEVTITAAVGGKTATCQVTVNPIAVASVQLSLSEASLYRGETLTLTATIEPENADIQDIVWESSNVGVATVSGGIVTAVGEGEALISAKAGDVSAQCKVTVSVKHVQQLTLSKTSAQLTKGETLQLTATVTPADADFDGFTWSSSEPAVATVSSEGLVTAVAAGNATITVQADGKTATCVVTVAEKLAESVSLDVHEKQVTEGEVFTLTASVLPADADSVVYVWETSDPTVATVENGVVTTLKPGSVTITVKVGDLSDQCAVTVLLDPAKHTGGEDLGGESVDPWNE